MRQDASPTIEVGSLADCGREGGDLRRPIRIGRPFSRDGRSISEQLGQFEVGQDHLTGAGENDVFRRQFSANDVVLMQRLQSRRDLRHDACQIGQRRAVDQPLRERRSLDPFVDDPPRGAADIGKGLAVLGDVRVTADRLAHHRVAKEPLARLLPIDGGQLTQVITLPASIRVGQMPVSELEDLVGQPVGRQPPVADKQVQFTGVRHAAQ